MPHTLTNKSPAEMFLGRKLCTKLDLIRPTEESTANQDTPEKFFVHKERVACRNYSEQKKWNFGKIIEKLGKLHYKIKLNDGHSWNRHVNQIRRIGENIPIINNQQNDDFYWSIPETRRENQNNDPQVENVQPPNEIQIDASAFLHAEC